MYRVFFKRVLDIIISLAALPFVLLVLLVFVPLIKLEDGGKAFYVSKRLGRYGKCFNMYKLRSMKMDAPDLRTKDNETFNSEDDERVTRIGRIIRKTSIDELPQFFNVLKGDMSLIGPRPNLWDRCFEELTEIEQKRIQVRPGITGYSQAFFRNSITKEEKFENDLFYVEHLTFLFDVRIFVQTIKSILLKKNVYNSEV